jgi:hypothetical protein
MTDEQFARYWGSPECVRNYHFYAYEYLDDLSFMRSATDYFDCWTSGAAVVAAVAEKFKQLGWAGDGEFQVFWLPPFAGAGNHDFVGAYCIHVKQNDDGISWIASPVTLPFHRLFQPDSSKVPPPSSLDPLAKPQRKGMIRWLSDFMK